MALTRTKAYPPKTPSLHDWRTTDTDEINRRRLRAREESFRITNTDPRHPVFSNFRVESGSGLEYSVEIRDVRQRLFACDCVDFRINGLGTCKHVEAVLLQLGGRFRRLFRSAERNGSSRIEIVVDAEADTLRVCNGQRELPRPVQRWFAKDGRLSEGLAPEAVLEALEQLHSSSLPKIRISQETAAWVENRRRAAERKQLRHEYELKVQSGVWPAQETKVPLFPYQRAGMLHLAFTERALLADEMGLGKTIQAIAAAALLRRLSQARRALIVTPASLKTEWEEQIQRFTDLPYQLVFGARSQRLKAYGRGDATSERRSGSEGVEARGNSDVGVQGPGRSDKQGLDRLEACPTAAGTESRAPFFTIVNYEQMLTDALEVNERLRPDLVVLDEAQRIKNWSTKTAQAIKRLRSRYAFVLTGTPIENRIDELHSLMDFLNPAVLGPLFRFNRDFYELDERGRPKGYRNLDQLHARIKPHMLRRRKFEVETELPERTDRHHFVPLTELQKQSYGAHEKQVARLIEIAKRRPLTKQEQEKLQRELAMMRMICDTNYILDPEDRECPKLGELEKILEECRENDAKVIVFSEWERMLQLVRDLCERLEMGFAWHTGSVPQLRRRAEINAFKNDSRCRVFLSTDSGATGLNLQNASLVINCDLPWNPAKLEQRIARAWRKHQTKPVTVINLVAENTIESRMLDTLANKQALADGVLDLRGDLARIQFRGGQQAFLARLRQLMEPPAPAAHPQPASAVGPQPSSVPSDRPLAFAHRVRDTIDGALVRCEERYPSEGAHTVVLVVVDQNPAQHQRRVASLHEELFGPGQTDPLAPVQLEIIDRATDEALQRLVAAGLIQATVRASRPLFPGPETGSSRLTAEERGQAQAHRALALRKLKMARLLGEGGLSEEARSPLLEAVHGLARALAVESRLPEPADLKESLLPPLSHAWNDALPMLRSFVAGTTEPWRPVVERLEKV